MCCLVRLISVMTTNMGVDMKEKDIDNLVSIFKGAELFTLVAGDVIGKGAFRTVHECRLNSNYVIKVEDVLDGSSYKHNVKEWNFYRETLYTKSISKWLAPCIAISACGTYLIQQRATPLPENTKRIKLPAFISDIKRENLGIINGKIVCLDYSILNFDIKDNLVAHTI